MTRSSRAMLQEREELESFRPLWVGTSKSLLQVSMNIPGRQKDIPEAFFLHDLCMYTLQHIFTTYNCEARLFWYSHTLIGPVALFGVETDPTALKTIMLEAEQADSRSIYWDLDVFDQNGDKLSRSDMHMPPRRCFLCEQSAKVCSFLHSHHTSELLQKLREDVRSEGERRT